MSWTDAVARGRTGNGADGGLVHRARLDGTRSQVAFSVLLDTLARPGRVASLAAVGLPPGVPAPLVLPLALADVETPVAVVTGDPDSPWPHLVRDVTGAPLVDVVSAAQVVLLDGFGGADILAARRGTAQEPEYGARMALSCRALVPRGAPHDDDSGPPPCTVELELTGPGVDGVARLGIDGLPAGVFGALAEANAAFPSGVDCWFVTAHGDIAALPRSTQVRVVRPHPTTEEI
ncbi:MAG: phosphonate C-P lyase system protein PhnH [Acidimicrobiales bacterium]